MNAVQEKLFLELRQTKHEIEDSLQQREVENWLKKILKEELADVDAALNKFKTGKFGQCEVSGEIMPSELIQSIPTLKSINDSQRLNSFCKKSLGSPY